MVNGKMFDRAVTFLGLVLLIAVVGIIGITAFTDKGIPDILQNLSSSALAGLIGLLVQKGGDEDNPMPMKLVDSEPVQTVEVEPEPTKPRTRTRKGN